MSTRSVPLPKPIALALKRDGRGASGRLLSLVIAEAERDRPLRTLERSDVVYIPVPVNSMMAATLARMRIRHCLDEEVSDGEVLGRLAVTAVRGPPLAVRPTHLSTGSPENPD